MRKLLFYGWSACVLLCAFNGLYCEPYQAPNEGQSGREQNVDRVHEQIAKEESLDANTTLDISSNKESFIKDELGAQKEHVYEQNGDISSSLEQRCPVVCKQDKECTLAACGERVKCFSNRCRRPTTFCPTTCSSNQECNRASCHGRTLCQKGKCTYPSVSCPAQCEKDIDCAWKACGTRTLCRQGHCTEPIHCPKQPCPSGQTCHSKTNTCVQCTQDAHCSKGRCDLKKNRCVECLGHTDCPSSQKCDLQTHRCVACIRNQDCTSGELCSSRRVCVPKGSCSSTSDCAADQICDPVKGRCIGCLRDSDCGMGETCNTTTQKCIRCLKDSDCTYSKRCVAGQCLKQGECEDRRDCFSRLPYCKKQAHQRVGRCSECSQKDANQCDERFVCDPVAGKCIPKQNTSCKSSRDCSLGHYCNTATLKCVKGCLSSTDCASKQTCDVQKKSCIDCTKDTDCPTKSHCVSGMCKPGCSTSQNCGKGQVCNAQKKQCVPGCTAHIDCPKGHLCSAQSKQCITPCSSSSHCASDQICDTVGGRGCVECMQDMDCIRKGDEKVCVQNRCIRKQCTKDSECPSSKWFCSARDKTCKLVCFPKPGGGCFTRKCNQDKHCREGEICKTQMEQCVSGCRTNADCPHTLLPSNHTRCKDNRCRQCYLDTHCPGNQRCNFKPTDEASGQCFTPCEFTGGPSSCKSLKCHPKTGRCELCYKDSHCPSGLVCVQTKVGHYCKKKGSLSLCQPCTQDSECGTGNLCLGFPCESAPRERGCGFVCDAQHPCPRGYKCASIERQGKMYKQCVPFLYRNQCNQAISASCKNSRGGYGRICRTTRDCPSSSGHGTSFSCVLCSSQGGNRPDCSSAPRARQPWGRCQ